jgi:hypothetical protein
LDSIFTTPRSSYREKPSCAGNGGHPERVGAKFSDQFGAKKVAVVFGIFIVLFFSFTEVNLDTFSKLKTLEECFSYISKNILPVVFYNVFMTFAAYILGFNGTAIYAALTKFPIWIVRILPNFAGSLCCW